MTRAEILAILNAHRHELRGDFGVAQIGIFGSAARDELRADSDVDVLVQFDPNVRMGLFGFVRLQKHLESLLHRQVDLATPNSLKRQIKQRILGELVRAA